tara:strand:- start:848 stop:979 length:132 start_codon:yes stop_codon:yes gene_type:complete
MTLAPKLKGSIEFNRRLSEFNIAFSLGHFLADFDSAMKALTMG